MLKRLWHKNLSRLSLGIKHRSLNCDYGERRARYSSCRARASSTTLPLFARPKYFPDFDDYQRRTMSSSEVPPHGVGSLGDRIYDFINSNEVALFSKSWCPYCKKAKDLLELRGASYKVWELDQDANGDMIQAKLLEISGQKTVPNIYIKKKHIGGFSDLNSLEEAGALADLVNPQGTPQQQVSPGERVNDFIKDNEVAMFSKSWCPYCSKAKELLQRRGASYKSMELDQDENGDLIQAKLFEISGQKTVPNIYIKGKHIGGFSDLVSLDGKGALMGLLGSNNDSPRCQVSLTDKIDGFIRANAIAVFSKSWCPYCQKAKSLLASHGAPYEAMELDQLDEGGDIQQLLFEISKQKTVPNIFIHGKHIGGFSDLSALDESGQLKKLLDSTSNSSSDPVRKKVETLINDHKVVIFSKTWCPWCTKAKNLLSGQGVEFKAHELDLDDEGPQAQQHLLEISKQKTVPNIFINGKHIGGYSDLSSLEACGLLEEEIAGMNLGFDYDLIVIGGGSGGISAAKEARNAGKKVALCDFVSPSPRGTIWGLGGTCVNVGCIPKKLMHRAAIIKQDIKDSIDFGWQLPGDILNLSHSWETMVQNIQEYICSLNDGYLQQLEENKVVYYNAKASLLDRHTVRIVGKDGLPLDLKTKNILIAVGGRPSHLDLPNAKELCISSDDVFSLKRPPGKTLVIGASYIALECAGFLKALGYDVTIMVRSILLRGFDKECASKIGEHIEAYGVTVVWKCVPISLEKVFDGEKEQIWVRGAHDNGDSFEGKFDTVLVAVGRTALTGDLNLAAAGVDINPKNKKIIVNEKDQTTCKNIFAVGDVIERPELTPVAIQAGKLLAKRLYSGGSELMDYTNVPTTVFTPLEYGCVGLSEEAAIQEHGEGNIEVYHSTFTPLEYSLRTWGTPELSEAFAKLICLKENKEQYVIGLHILSPNAGEITQGFALGVRLKLTKSQFDALVGIHPTVAEAFTDLKVTKSSGEDAAKGGC